MKKLLLLVAFLGLCQVLLAVPAKRGAIRVIDGDGMELTIRVYGDEFFSYKTTDDGYQVVQKDDGNYYYYSSSLTRSNGSLVKAHNAGSRTPAESAFLSTISVGVDASYSSEGLMNASAKRMVMDMTVPSKALAMQGSAQQETKASSLPANGLVIVVEFLDVKLRSGRTMTEFTNLLNQEGYSLNGGTGSARDFFKENSKGRYNPEFVVCPQVISLPHTQAYYGAHSGSDSDVRPREMIADACIGADAYVNFAEYDVDGNGKVDNVFVYYAGHNEAELGPDNSVWPHRWVVNNQVVMLDGVQIYDYACTSELRSSSGSTLAGIGTFTHEFGHVLGLPDFYDTDGDASGGNSPGLYDVSTMCGGSYNNDGCTPPYYTAIERSLVGWNKLIPLQADKSYTLDAINIANDAYVIPATDDNEFYIIEARDGSKGWDKHLRATGGLLIYHIDMSTKHIVLGQYTASNMWMYRKINVAPGKECAKLIESGGYNVSIRSSQNGLFYPGSKGVKSFGAGSYGGIDNDGMPIRMELQNIAFSGGVVTFDVISKSVKYPTINISKTIYNVGESMAVNIKNSPSDAKSISWIVEDVAHANGERHTFTKSGKTSIVCKIKYDDGSEEVITRVIKVQ